MRVVFGEFMLDEVAKRWRECVSQFAQEQRGSYENHVAELAALSGFVKVRCHFTGKVFGGVVPMILFLIAGLGTCYASAAK